jgi:hypothetical protein
MMKKALGHAYRENDSEFESKLPEKRQTKAIKAVWTGD